MTTKPEPLRGEIVPVEAERARSERAQKTIGRPTKLTSERAARICRLIRNGSYRTQAALAVGIARSTFQLWMRSPRRIQVMRITTERTSTGYHETKTLTDDYLRFSDMVEQAEAECEAELAGRVMLAAQRPNDGGVRAAVELLQRRFPDRWKLTAAVEHSGTIEVDVAEVRERVYGRLAKLAVIEGGANAPQEGETA